MIDAPILLRAHSVNVLQVRHRCRTPMYGTTNTQKQMSHRIKHTIYSLPPLTHPSRDMTVELTNIN